MNMASRAKLFHVSLTSLLNSRWVLLWIEVDVEVEDASVCVLFLFPPRVALVCDFRDDGCCLFGAVGRSSEVGLEPHGPVEVIRPRLDEVVLGHFDGVLVLEQKVPQRRLLVEVRARDEDQRNAVHYHLKIRVIERTYERMHA